jgi:hypothetical protein
MTKKYAVLIDADNISYKHAGDIISFSMSFGDTSLRRMYGNWSIPALSNWRKAGGVYQIKRCEHFTPSPTKNASDFAMTIHAMDILHKGDVDGFIIVSSDGDFASLIARLRQSGKDVFGIGLALTPKFMRESCSKFTTIESLIKPAPPPVLKNKKKAVFRASHGTEAEVMRVLAEAVLKPLFLKAFLFAPDGGLTLSDLGGRLKRVDPRFSATAFGHNNLSGMVSDLPWLNLHREKGELLISLRVSPPVWFEPVAAPVGD